jgi:hypothetical protein
MSQNVRKACVFVIVRVGGSLPMTSLGGERRLAAIAEFH